MKEVIRRSHPEKMIVVCLPEGFVLNFIEFHKGEKDEETNLFVGSDYDHEHAPGCMRSASY
jgi:hypothetical protein